MVTQVGADIVCANCPSCCPYDCGDDVPIKTCPGQATPVQTINIWNGCSHNPDLLQWLNAAGVQLIENAIRNAFGVIFGIPQSQSGNIGTVMVTACKYQKDGIFVTVLRDRAFSMDIWYEAGGQWITHAGGACSPGQCPITGNSWSIGFCNLYISTCYADITSSVTSMLIEFGCCDGQGNPIECLH